MSELNESEIRFIGISPLPININNNIINDLNVLLLDYLTIQSLCSLSKTNKYFNKKIND